MKNIFKYILLFVLGAVVLSSCEDLESNYAAMTDDYDKNNPAYYIQFMNASQYYQTEIDEAGLPKDIVTTVAVMLQGAPQSSDIVVTLVESAESTLPSAAYTLSANSITIPAGSTSGSVDLTVLAANMVEDATVHLILDMDAGGAEAATAAQLDYELKRIKFCPYTTLDEFVGNYGGVDEVWGHEASVSCFMEGENLMIDGLGVAWMTGWWGEVITSQTPVIMTMNPDGTLVIEEQPYQETTWNGAPQPAYSIAGSGLWDNCKKTLEIEFVYIQGGGALSYDFKEVLTMK